MMKRNCRIIHVKFHQSTHGVFRRGKSATRGLYFGLKTISSPPLPENDIFPPLTTCFSSPFPPFLPLFFTILHSFYPSTSYFLFFLFFPFFFFHFPRFYLPPFLYSPPPQMTMLKKFSPGKGGIFISRKNSSREKGGKYYL